MQRRLRLLRGPGEMREYPLNKTTIIVGRWDPEQNPKPDIDIYQDYRVSRRHCKIWFEHGEYWIKDLDSTNGTLVNNEEIQKYFEGIRLQKNSEIRIGHSVLRFESMNHCYLEHNGLIITFELLPRINFSLVHSGLPLIADFEVINKTDSVVESLDFSFSVSGYSKEEKLKIDALRPKQRGRAAAINITMTDSKLEELTEKRVSQFILKLNNEIIMKNDISILEYNVFSLEETEEHQVSLAYFIQPKHPCIKGIFAKIDRLKELRKLQPPECYKEIIQAIYECLSKDYKIDYDLEVSFSAKEQTQRIRLAHQIFDTDNFHGKGTCIDLALLMASCIENVGFKPLIFLIRNATGAHAIAGSWLENNCNYKPLLFDKEDILDLIESKRVLPIECIGFTQGEKRLIFLDAIKKAIELVQNNELIFTLDVDAARKYGGDDGVPPGPPKGPPKYSERVNEVFKKAQILALENQNRELNRIHLFLGLLTLSNGLIPKIVLRKGVDIAKAMAQIIKMIPKGVEVSFSPPESKGYQLVKLSASLDAKSEGSYFIEESHLIRALLEVPIEVPSGSQGTVAKYQFEKVGVDWRDVSQKLIENGWAEKISPTVVRLTANWEQKIDQMLKIFGDDFSKILPILLQPSNYLETVMDLVSISRKEIFDALLPFQKRKGTVVKLKISEVDSNRGTMLAELIKKGVVDDISATEVCLRPNLEQKESLVREIAKDKFDEIWALLRQARKRPGGTFLVYDFPS